MATKEHDPLRPDRRERSYSPVTFEGCRMQAWFDEQTTDQAASSENAVNAKLRSLREEEQEPERWDGLS